MAAYHKNLEQPNSQIWLIEIVIHRGQEFPNLHRLHFAGKRLQIVMQKNIYLWKCEKEDEQALEVKFSSSPSKMSASTNRLHW